jgi:uncharacterized protein with PIN domain
MEKTLRCEKCKNPISGKPEKASLPAVDPDGKTLVVPFLFCKTCYASLPTGSDEQWNALLELLKSRDPKAVIVLEKG